MESGYKPLYEYYRAGGKNCMRHMLLASLTICYQGCIPAVTD
jgi:hypothetical protein